MPYFHFPQSPVSTPDNDFVTIPAFFTYDGGDGDDFIVGDSPISGGFFIAPTGNNSQANALSIDDAAKWVSSAFALPSYMNVSAPTTTVYVSGEGEFEFFSFSVTSGDVITLDVDFANFNSLIGLYDENDTFLALNDSGAGDQGDLSGTESFLTFTATSTGTYSFIIQEADGTAMDAGDQAIVNVSVTGHATTSAPTGASQTLLGGAGNDQIYAGLGDDTVEGGEGDDYLDGGSGNDTLSFANYDNGDGTGVSVALANSTTTNAGSGTDTITGFENIIGSAFNDSLLGRGATEDIMNGGAGNDNMRTFGGADQLYGEAGNDQFSIDAASDFTGALLDGGADNDVISFFGFSTGLVNDFRGVTIVDVERVQMQINSTSSITSQFTAAQFSEFDTVTILPSAHVGLGGVYEIFMDGETVLDLTATSFVGFVEPGDKIVVLGDDDNETMIGSSVNDELRGGDGDDTIAGGLGDDILVGGTNDFDTLTYANSLTGVTANLDTGVVTGEGTDSVSQFDRFVGSVQADTVTLSDNGTVIELGGGNDTLALLAAGNFNGSYDGGAGVDTFDFSAGFDGANPWTINLATEEFSFVNGSTDVADLIDFENVFGSIGADIITGNGEDNELSGNDGADEIFGGGGADVIFGGAGIDTLSGDAGNDTFLYGPEIVDAGESVDGGADTDTVLIAGPDGTTDFTGVDFTSIEAIGFGNASPLSGYERTVIFDSAEIGAGLDSALAITTDAGLGNALSVIINMGMDTDLNLTNWVLTDWSEEDTITINGGVTVDNIVGSGGNDIINAGDGADQINAGDGADEVYAGGGNDFIYFNAASQLLVGEETIDGGGDTDVLVLQGLDNQYDFTGSTIASIEQVIFVTQGVSIIAESDQFGAGFDDALFLRGFLTGNSVEALTININTNFDGSAFTFEAWNAEDTITLNGDENNRDIRGTSQVDIINGGAGNERFTIHADDIGHFENDTFNGGGDSFDGSDDSGDQLFIRAAAGNQTFDLRAATILDIEELEFSDLEDGYNATLVLNAEQIGNGGLADNAFVFLGGFTGVYTIAIELGLETTLDLSGWNFVSVESSDSVEINGDSDTETITGSEIRDSVFTRGGDDVVFGLGGDDNFNLNVGAETVDGGDDTDTVSYLNADAGVTVDLTDSANSTGFAAGDSYVSIERFVGSFQNDVFYADDTATDFVDLGGVDRVSYLRATEGVNVNLTSGLRSGAFAIGDTYSGIETFEGSDFNDLFFGTAGEERFEGAGGNDNLQGRAGNDRLFGEDGEDRLDGGGDNDQLFGGADNDLLDGNAGDDRLWGGEGADEIIGGSGRDRAEYGGADVGVTVNMLNTSLNTGDAFGDSYTSLEDLGGSAFGDNLTGDNGVNRIFGNNGDDVLYGEGGQDRLFGGNGNDTVYGGDAQDDVQGGDGNDTLYGNIGNDKLIGNDGDDVLFGGNDNDFLSGGDGDDRMIGGNGNDRMFGGEGADEFIGNLGTDRADYSTSANGVTLSLIAGGTAGEALGDTFSSIEWVFGSDFSDNMTLNNISGNRLYGRQGDDTLIGGSGDDRLYGQADSDTLIGNDGLDRLFGGDGIDFLDGGAGNDQLFGGADIDVFVFSAGYERDTIYDFEDGTDFIDANAFTMSEITAALASKTQIGLSTQLDFGNGDILILRNMDIADVTIDDFFMGAL